MTMGQGGHRRGGYAKNRQHYEDVSKSESHYHILAAHAEGRMQIA
jgi:hypothetical protein